LIGMVELTCQRCMIERRIRNFREVERELSEPHAGAHPDELAMARRAYDAALELLGGYQHTCG
jgi:hypothetical protein